MSHPELDHAAGAPAPSPWRTVSHTRTVLGVAHNLTAATRLFDLLDLLADDTRVQVAVTCPGSSEFQFGLDPYLAERGVARIPWEQAVAERFDLAIAASCGGDLHRLRAPLVIAPHGMGYNKRLARMSDVGCRMSDVGCRMSAGGRAPFGLSREWLTHQGGVLPSLLLLSHAEQLSRLRAACPEALPVAAVVGDVCLDRMLASQPLRPVYRRAFGVGPGQRLVFVSSTWGARSLFGADPGLARRLAAELPLDEHRIVLALHPNVWDFHSPWQVRGWLRECERAGVRVTPPEEGWRAALIAADVVVGDHGSVAFYGAALGRPLLLATFPADTLDPASPVAQLGRVAPRLDPSRGLAAQLDAVVAGHDPTRHQAITSLASSAPGQATALLRPRLYALMDLPERPAPPDVSVVPIPPLQRAAPAAYRALGLWSQASDDSWQARVTRRHAEPRTPTANGHLVVDLATASAGQLRQADVVLRRTSRRQDAEPPWSWPDAEPPGPSLAAAVAGSRHCVLEARDGGVLRIEAVEPDPTPAGWDMAAAASAVHAWLDAGRPLATFPDRFPVTLGPATVLLSATLVTATAVAPR